MPRSGRCMVPAPADMCAVRSLVSDARCMVPAPADVCTVPSIGCRCMLLCCGFLTAARRVRSRCVAVHLESATAQSTLRLSLASPAGVRVLV
jgi:hypothetical protein